MHTSLRAHRCRAYPAPVATPLRAGSFALGLRAWGVFYCSSLTTVPRRNTRPNGVQVSPAQFGRGLFFINLMAHEARQPSAAHHGNDMDAGLTGCIPGQASGPLTNVPTRFHFRAFSAAAAASKSRAMRASSQASLASAQVWCVSSIRQLSLTPNRGFKRVSGEF